MARSSAITEDCPSSREATAPDIGARLGASSPAGAAGPSFSACCTNPRSTARSTGLLTKSNAPAFSAPTAASWLPNAVIIATGVCA